MKKIAACLSIFIIIMAVSVSHAGHESMVIPYENLIFGEKTMMPLPEGGDLRQYIIGQEPYRDWKYWPGKAALYEGTEPHGALLTTYVNDVAGKSLEKMTGFRNNSVIVKENYTPKKELAAITVMYKVKGYNPEAGDWFWAKYDPAFNVLAEGKVKGCLACHGSASDNDYVFTGKVK